jgi:5-hydroxyisourate hydrolase-like protein (transthyretin family)
MAAVCFGSSAFAQSGGVKGRVRSNSGSGIANASVTARRDGKDVKSARTDSKGNFVMQGLASGVYNIVFDAGGYSSGVKYNVEIKDKKIRDLGDRLILSIDKGSQVILKGSVFFKEGFTATGVKVEIERVNADGTVKHLGEVFTNGFGEFTFLQPEGPAKLRLTARYKEGSGTKEVDVDGAAIYRLAISLDISKTEK